MSSDEERQHYHNSGSNEDVYGTNLGGMNGHQRYRDESSSSEEEPMKKSDQLPKDLDFEPIEKMKKVKRDSFGRPVSNGSKRGYDREVESDGDGCKFVAHAPPGWPMPRQKPEYDADDEDEVDVPEPEDPMISQFEILSEDRRGRSEEHRFVAENYDEHEHERYLSRAAPRPFHESKDEDFDVISFATNDAQSLVEVNARNLKVDIHWRDGHRPGNGADRQAIGKAVSQHLHTPRKISFRL